MARDPQKNREAARRYYWRHRDKVLEGARVYNAKNRDKKREYCRIYDARTKESRKEKKSVLGRSRYQEKGRDGYFQWKATPTGRAMTLVNAARLRARKNGWDFDLDVADIQRRIEAGHCEVTGLPFDLVPDGHKPWVPSLDRTDSSKGYTMDNVRVVVWLYNAAKNNATDADVERLAGALMNRPVAKVIEVG